MIWANKMKLYEITNKIQNTFELNDENGELSEQVLEDLDLLQMDFDEKAISIASYIKNLEAESKAIGDALNDMRERRNKIDNNIEKMSEYLKHNLMSLSLFEINSSPYFKIKIKKCPPSVDVFNEEEIPEEYWQERVTKVLSKRNLLDDLKQGQEIPGASIKNNLKLEIK